MYDLITTSLLFILLTPGVVLTLPPGASILTAAIVHAIVFYVVQMYLSQFVPWWGIWIAVVVILGARFYGGGSSTPTPMF